MGLFELCWVYSNTRSFKGEGFNHALSVCVWMEASLFLVPIPKKKKKFPIRNQCECHYGYVRKVLHLCSSFNKKIEIQQKH